MLPILINMTLRKFEYNEDGSGFIIRYLVPTEYVQKIINHAPTSFKSMKRNVEIEGGKIKSFIYGFKTSGDICFIIILRDDYGNHYNVNYDYNSLKKIWFLGEITSVE